MKKTTIALLSTAVMLTGALSGSRKQFKRVRRSVQYGLVRQKSEAVPADR
ncbi:hypothetical protein LJK87_13175 [Paenibacillus sp. P25]|nr:hypothetical protein LJK87_13175 [Paenibacillus sp. P25]